MDALTKPPKLGTNKVTSCPGATVSGTGAEYPELLITGAPDWANAVPARAMTMMIGSI
jgi:hypothetical protein